jgi:hypothetical protein
MKTAALTVLVIAVIWSASAVVRLENYRYANFLGSCSQFNIADPMQRVKREICLEQSETRTSWVWHLLYGLKII